jgi:hypothetical protein
LLPAPFHDRRILFQVFFTGPALILHKVNTMSSNFQAHGRLETRSTVSRRSPGPGMFGHPPDIMMPTQAGKQPTVYWGAIAVAAALTLAIVAGLTAWVCSQPRGDAVEVPAPFDLPVQVAAAPAVEPPSQQKRTEAPTPAPVQTKEPSTEKAEPVSAEPTPPPAEGICPVSIEGPPCDTPQNYGTSIDFLSTPAAAAEQARREGKLMLVLHVAGNFEDSCFT